MPELSVQVIRFGLELHHLEMGLNQVAAYGYILSCLEFVSGQHPNFNIGLDHVPNSFGNIVLQSIEHSCGSKKG